MAWDDEAPPAKEKAKSWDAEPPSKASYLDKDFYGVTPRGLIQGGLNALPTAGFVGGGLIGSGAGGPVGGVAGAGLGAVGGQGLKNLGEQYILGKEAPTRKDYYTDLGKAGVEGVENQMLGDSLTGGAKALAESKPGQYVIGKAGKGAAYLASSLSGVPQKEIETYAKHADEIANMAQAADRDHQEMADQMRDKFNDQIQNTRRGLNEQIGQTLEKRAGQSVESKPVLDALEAEKAKLNPKLRQPEIKEVQDLISKVEDLGSKDGKIGLKDAHDLKEYLQDVAEGSYQRDGQIFIPGDKTARAAKSGAAKVRLMINEQAPEVASANNQLSELRDIASVMNKNMLANGKPAASFYAAGAETNPTGTKVLQRLGEATGNDMLGDANKLAAARTFDKPALLPVDTTGKSLTRLRVAGALGGAGYAVGGLPGAAIAEGLSSPLAVKYGILAGRSAGGMLNNTPQLSGLLLRRGLMKKGLLDEQNR